MSLQLLFFYHGNKPFLSNYLTGYSVFVITLFKRPLSYFSAVALWSCMLAKLKVLDLAYFGFSLTGQCSKDGYDTG